MIFNRRARDWTELFVRFSWCPISPELAPASANFRRLSSSACVHGREAWRAGSFFCFHLEPELDQAADGAGRHFARRPVLSSRECRSVFSGSFEVVRRFDFRCNH